MRSRKSHFGIPEDLEKLKGIMAKGQPCAHCTTRRLTPTESIGLKIRDEDEYGFDDCHCDFFNPIKDQEGTNDSYLKEIIESAESITIQRSCKNEIVISAEIGGELVFPEPESNEDVLLPRRVQEDDRGRGC